MNNIWYYITKFNHKKSRQDSPKRGVGAALAQKSSCCAQILHKSDTEYRPLDRKGKTVQTDGASA